MTAAAQRTPVSVLFEMCCQNDWVPDYELTSCEGASHDPTFTYRVKVADIQATASGQSKQKAKHFAAKSALEQILSKPDTLKNGSFFFENREVTLENLAEIILVPSAEPAPVGNDSRNAVGELQEYRMKLKTSPPYYETVSDSGPPHDKCFSVMCIVDEFTTYGEGKTKKLAKRAAAEEMYRLVLQNSDKKDNTGSDGDSSKKVCDEENSEIVCDEETSEIVCDEENSKKVCDEEYSKKLSGEDKKFPLPETGSTLDDVTNSFNNLET